METMKKLFILGAIALIALIVVASANPALINTMQEHRGYLYATIGIGNSMYPQIQSGDLIVIMKKTDPAFSVAIGDIIVFKYDEKIVAHRVFFIGQESFYVKGDNNPDADAIIVNDSTLIGKVIQTVGRDNLIGKAIVEAML